MFELFAVAAAHLKVFVLVLVFVFNGEVVMEKRAYKTEGECKMEAAKRVNEVQKDPRFEGGLGAWCLELPGQKS